MNLLLDTHVLLWWLDDLDRALYDCGFASLPVTVLHAMAVRSLPSHHRDPFDRMLVAQALAEGLTVVSRDAIVLRYPVPSILA